MSKQKAKAQSDLREMEERLLLEGSLVMISASVGEDLAKSYFDRRLRPVKSEAKRSASESLTRHHDVVWTPRKMANHLHAGRDAVIVSRPDRVAWEMEVWMEDAGIRGFNLSSGIRLGL